MPARPQSQTPSDRVLNIGGGAAPVAGQAAAIPAPVAALPQPTAAPQPDLDAILQTLGAQTIAAQPRPTGPPRGMQMDGTYKDKDVTIYSTTGESRTEQDFNMALAQYNTTNKIPAGYTVLEPGIMSNLRSGFETVRQPLRKAVEELDDPNLPLNRMLPGFVSAVPKFLARQVNEEVKTPEKAAMFLGTLAAGPFLKATTTLAGGINKLAMVGNAAKTVGTAGALGAAADVATGETPNMRLGVELGMLALGSGMQGIVSHVVGKYVMPDLQQPVLDNIRNTITKKYPILANNPKAIDIGASSGDQLFQMGQQMANGLRGTVDDVNKSLLFEINNAFSPTAYRLSADVQKTFRARIRDFAQAGNDMLDNINDPKALQAARTSYNDAITDIGKLVQNEVAAAVTKGGGDPKAVARNISSVLDMNRIKMNQLDEGAQVLGYLNKAANGKGFDPMMFRNVLVNDSYKSPRGQLLQDVQQLLAGGQIGGPSASLTKLPIQRESELSLPGALANMAKQFIPGVKHVPTGSLIKSTPVLPYQRPQNAPYAINMGSQLAGKEAIDAFVSKK